MKKHALCLVGALSVLLPCVVEAQPQHAYPAKGQSAARQQKDETECSRWATGQSGYDPAHPPAVPVAHAAPVTGSGARVRGAAMGAGVGAITGGDVGDSAVRGAVVGGVVRRVKNRRAANQTNEVNAQQVQAMQSEWTQARGACLKGRGYTVN